MFPIPSSVRTYSYAPGSTAAQAFGTDVPARLVVFQAPPTNVGTVTILGVQGDGTKDSAGLVLAAGGFSPSLWVKNLSQLAYKLSNSADTLVALVTS